MFENDWVKSLWIRGRLRSRRQRVSCLLSSAGEDRDQRGKQTPDTSGPRFSTAGGSQKNSAVNGPKTHQLCSTGEPGVHPETLSFGLN